MPRPDVRSPELSGLPAGTQLVFDVARHGRPVDSYASIQFRARVAPVTSLVPKIARNGGHSRLLEVSPYLCM
jgi:hypothetical protein